MAARNNTGPAGRRSPLGNGGYEVIAQHGGPIPTSNDREKIIVQHVRVNGQERVEIRGRWVDEATGREGNIGYTDSRGKRKTVCLPMVTEADLDLLIACLESAKADFTETPAKVVEEQVEQAKAPVKEVVVNPTGRARARRAATKKSA